MAKTILTDRYSLYPWFLSAMSCWMFLLAYEHFGDGNAIRSLVDAGAGAFFLTLAIKRFAEIRRAKREGRDHTIVRIKETLR